MPARVTCPNCHATLKVPDSLAGRSAECPRCKGRVPVPAPPTPEPDPLGPVAPEPPDEPARPRVRRPAGDGPRTRDGFKLGLGMSFGAMAAVVLAAGTLLVGSAVVCCGGGLAVLAPAAKKVADEAERVKAEKAKAEQKGSVPVDAPATNR